MVMMGEYTSNEFWQFCRAEGIKHVKTVPGTPQQNGVAERYNRTILDRVRSMLKHSGLAKPFWAEAASTTMYLINRSPSAALEGEVPDIVWSGRSIEYHHLKTFGCEAYVHVPKENRSKLDERAHKYILVGYGGDDRGYKLWDLVAKKTIRSRDVTFNENVMYSATKQQEKVKFPEVIVPSTERLPFQEIDQNQQEDGHGEEVAENNQQIEEQEEKHDEEVVEPQLYELVQGQTPTHWVRKSIRARKKPDRYSPSLYYILYTDSGEPESMREAIQSPKKERWQSAMDEEMQSLWQNQTWELVSLPLGRKALKNRWIYRLKSEIDGSQRYKARLVVKGYAQIEGIDFTEIFSPVVNPSSIRIVLSLVACMDLELEQLDIKTAFLHGDLDEDIYMEQPEGYVDQQHATHVCKLKRSLYGLKQAPRQWYKKFDAFMKKMKYHRSDMDHCVYFSGDISRKFVILLLYVDDMLLAGNDMAVIKNLKEEMSRKFEMKDLGETRQILGIEISRNRKDRKLWMSQEKYIGKVLQHFDMENAAALQLPCNR